MSSSISSLFKTINEAVLTPLYNTVVRKKSGVTAIQFWEMADAAIGVQKTVQQKAQRIHAFAPEIVKESFASECDKHDSLKAFRERFHIPSHENGQSKIYFCGHSLGLQPRKTQKIVQEELEAWAKLGVDGHFKPDAPWYSYHELVREPLAKLIGAKPQEVVAMNSLTVNLHLMMVSFYQPTSKRYKVLMEEPVFSSDTYAIKSQIDFRGYDSSKGLLVVKPQNGKDAVDLQDIEQLLEKQGDEIALVLLSAVNYFNGQLLDLKKITELAHKKGCMVGFDLAHAIGNVPLQLHEADVDFAVWCHYKYLNAGPGAIGGAFVHEKHLNNLNLKRFAGWWGNDPKTRFKLHLQPDFIPVAAADGWQLSNPSIMSLAPLRASLELFEQAGITRLREKSKRLTSYLEALIRQINSDKIEMITPNDLEQRGSMLSIKVDHEPKLLMDKLHKSGIIVDFREPNVLRITPMPLYNTFHEVWRFSTILKNHLTSN